MKGGWPRIIPIAEDEVGGGVVIATVHVEGWGFATFLFEPGRFPQQAHSFKQWDDEAAARAGHAADVEWFQRQRPN